MIDYLNEISLQSYPFVEESSTFGSVLPNSAVLDLDIVLGPYVPFPGSVLELINISASPSNVAFNFDYGGQIITFTVPKSTPWGGTIWSMTNPAVFTGFIQVGDISSIPSGTYIGKAVVEPSRYQGRYRSELMTVSVANKVGTLYSDTCDNYPDILNPYIYEVTGMTGDITVSPGRWAEVTQLENPSQIMFGPSTTEEEGGEPACGEDLTPKPDWWVDNEPTCDEVLNTINGISPSKGTKSFRISGSRGVSVGPGNDNTVEVYINTEAIFKNLLSVPLP